MPSVRAIAAHLKLSPATVSRVLNNHPDVDEKTRQRVLSRINATGYVPKVGRRATNVIALAYPDQPIRSEYGSFEPSLLSGVMRGLQDHHYDLKLLSIRRDKLPDESYTQFFLRKGIQGVILRCVHRTSDMIKRIATEGFPSVVVAARFDEPEVNFIDSDSYPSSRRAMEHLIGLGHRRIVLAIHNVSDTDHADRRRAYEDAMATAELPIDPTWIMELTASVSSGEQVLDAILAMPDRPTAVFATNPMTALGIMRRAQERGVVIPAELSVIGVDDSDVRMHVWPRLTAVTQDASMIGYEAAAWLTTVLSQEDVGKSCRRTVATAFEVNGTTAAPPGRKASAGPDGGRAPAARRSRRLPAVSARKS